MENRETATLGYLPEPKPKEVIAPPASETVRIQTESYNLDYADSSIISGLTPERLALVYRTADWGYPLHMVDIFEANLTVDCHLRGIWEQRMDEVAAQDWSIEPGDTSDPKSVEAATLLRDEIGWNDIHALIEHIMLAWFYGFSYAEMAWESKTSGMQRPVEIVCVPLRRFVFDANGNPLLTSAKQPQGAPLDRTDSTSWVRANSKRMRKPQQAGLFRPTAYASLFKRMSITDWMIFLRKFGLPMTVGKYAENSSEKTRKALLDALRSLGNEGIAMIEEGSIIEVMTGVLRSGSDSPQAPLVNLMNDEISKVLTSATLTTGTGGAGSFALGNVHATRAEKLTLADAQRVGIIFQKYVGEEFCRRNKIECRRPPRLKIHVKRDSEQGDAQVDTALSALGLPLSEVQLRERYGRRAPLSAADKVEPQKGIDSNAQPKNTQD